VDRNKRELCAYCGKWFDDETMFSLPYDGNPELGRRYCPKCYPEVREAHLNLPWIKKKTKERTTP
jgi:hypothetical protein